MIRNLCLASLVVAVIAAPVASAQQREARLDTQERTARLDAQQREARLDANGNLDALIARHAAANGLPEDLVRRVIARESRGNPRVVSKGNFGLMQIKLATARSMGYTGTAAGLLEADTNMTYAVKYLAGAYRVAGGNTGRAVHYYAAGYYYAAKAQGLPTRADGSLDAFASSPATGLTATAMNGSSSPAQTLNRAKAAAESVSSASSLYSGRLDFY